jgi:DNA mismatch endonuclease (patch repair protein)
MPDIVSPEVRSLMMSGIRGKDTGPELIVRRFLHSRGFRYRLHAKDLPGRPDVVLPKYRTAIFVHGCFWHRHQNCRFAYSPKSRQEFWEAKLEGNARRDERNQERLAAIGWSVAVVWECQTDDAQLAGCLDELLSTRRAVTTT